MTPAQEIALREAMMILAERENRRMRMVCHPTHPNWRRNDYGETTRHRVWNALGSAPLTSDQIADAIGATRKNVSGILRSMVRNGAVVQTCDDGVYRWSLVGAKKKENDND
jgi:predicted Rossmann fold nucleotide-binding protein DprA/Smf involved in DNA uptake